MGGGGLGLSLVARCGGLLDRGAVRGEVRGAVQTHVGRVDGQAGEGQRDAAGVHEVSASRAAAAVQLIVFLVLVAALQGRVGVNLSGR